MELALAEIECGMQKCNTPIRHIKIYNKCCESETDEILSVQQLQDRCTNTT